MSDRDSATDGIERRSVLAALATGLGGVGVARTSLARSVDVLDAPLFVVEQGNRCLPITPLSGDETAVELYDYRTPFTSPSGSAYSSYGTTDLQRPETSICFLYDGPKGLSLVVVHDKLNDGTSGGAATFDITLAHPDRGAWVVGDDDYDGSSNYDTFTDTADGWTVDWTWGVGRSDGGVYRPLGDDFAVTVDPAFNETADLYGDHYTGEITDWQFLSGDRSDPDRYSLALDRPITIRPGVCDVSTTTTTRETTEETTTQEDTAETDRSSEPIQPDMEILPEKVNPRSHGRLLVVVHSSAEFDATTLARESVELHPGKAEPVKRIRTDVDGDGRTDLKLHFWMDATDIDWNTTSVTLTGTTENGRPVEGVVDIDLVPRNGDDEDEDEEDDDEEREKKEEKRERKEEKREEKRERKEEKREEKRERKEEKREEKREKKEEKREEKRERKEEKRERKAEKRDEESEDEDEEDEEEDEDDRRGRGNGRGRGQNEGRGSGRGNGRGRGRDDEDDEDD